MSKYKLVRRGIYSVGESRHYSYPHLVEYVKNDKLVSRLSYTRKHYFNIRYVQPENNNKLSFRKGWTIPHRADVYGPEPLDTNAPLYATPLPINNSYSYETSSYSNVSSVLRIVFMFVLLLAYCNVVFGSVEVSPFDTGLSIAEEISSLGADSKTDFLDSFKSFAGDLNAMRALSPFSWGDDFSIEAFFSGLWSSLKIPFTLLGFIIQLFVIGFRFIGGISSIVFGLV